MATGPTVDDLNAFHGDGAIEYGRGKLERKGLDLLVANEVGREGTGFGSETNRDVGHLCGREQGGWRVGQVTGDRCRLGHGPASLGPLGNGLGVLVMDFTGDGRPDIYVANDFGPNRLYLNTGRGTFEDATTGFGIEDWYHGMGLAVADVDIPRGWVRVIGKGDKERRVPVDAAGCYVPGGRAAYPSSLVMGVAGAAWAWNRDAMRPSSTWT